MHNAIISYETILSTNMSMASLWYCHQRVPRDMFVTLSAHTHKRVISLIYMASVLIRVLLCHNLKYEHKVCCLNDTNISTKVQAYQNVPFLIMMA